MRTIAILVWDNIKNSLRTKKAIIFLALYLFIFFVLVSLFFNVQSQIEAEIGNQGVSDLQREFLTGFAKEVLQSYSDNSPIINFLFAVPPINIVLFFISLIGTPFLIFIINYDKVSQEIYDGTIRYLLFRASRFKIFFSKFLASMIECSVITFSAMFLGILWASNKYESVDFSISLDYGFRYWLIAQVFLAVFVAYSLMSSSIFKKPFTSLVFCFLSYVGMFVISLFVPYISPYTGVYFTGLFFHNSPELFQSLAIYGLYSVLFLGIGYFIFKRSDL